MYLEGIRDHIESIYKVYGRYVERISKEYRRYIKGISIRQGLSPFDWERECHLVIRRRSATLASGDGVPLFHLERKCHPFLRRGNATIALRQEILSF
jgi:hypothetical protein